MRHIIYKPNADKAIKSIVHLTLALFITITGKSMMSHPRPSWTSDEINAWACDPDFGNPSGHSLTSMTFAYFSSNPFLLCLALFVGFSRMVLGVHSLNQVFFGQALGILLAYLMQKYYRPISNKIACCVTLQILSFCVCIWLFIPRQLESDWVEKIVEKCGKDYVDRSTDNAYNIRTFGVLMMTSASMLGREKVNYSAS